MKTELLSSSWDDASALKALNEKELLLNLDTAASLQTELLSVPCVVRQDVLAESRHANEVIHNVDSCYSMCSHDSFNSVISANVFEENEALESIEELEKPQLPQLQHVRNAFLLPIIGCSGGSGKSSIAATCALMCASWGYKTLLIDANFQFGCQKALVSSAISIEANNLFNPAFCSDLVENRGTSPCLLNIPEKLENAEDAERALMAYVTAADDYFDVIVVDTCSYWNDTQMSLLKEASKVLVVVDQREAAIEATRKALRFCMSCGVSQNAITLALTFCSRKSRYTSTDLSLRLGNYTIFEIQDGGADLRECFEDSSLMELQELNNPFWLGVENLMQQFLPEAKVLATRSEPVFRFSQFLYQLFGKGKSTCHC